MTNPTKNPQFDSVNAERLHTDSLRESVRVYINDNGEYVSVTPNGGLIAPTTDFADILNNLESDTTDIEYGGGETVQTTKGTYVLQSPAYYSGGNNLEGAGMYSTELKLADGVNPTDIIEIEGGGNNSYFSKVCDLVINGNKSNNSSGRGLRIRGNAPDVHINNIMVRQCAGQGIRTESYGARISNVVSEFNDDWALWGAKKTYISNSKITASARGIRANQEMHIATSKIGGEDFPLYVDSTDQPFSMNGGKIEGGGGSNGYIRLYSGGSVRLHGVELNGIPIKTEGNPIDLLDLRGCTNVGTITNSQNVPIIYPGGAGRNSGDPSSTGIWNGNGIEGVRVYDTSVARPYTEYQYVDGAWQTA